MRFSLKDVPQSDMDELALVLSLPPENLRAVGHRSDKVRPASSWIASQRTEVAALPACFLRPSTPRGVVVRLSQLTKHVVMAAAGGAEYLATRGAAQGKHLDDRLHPRATPTVLCAVHKKMHPVMVREMFYYLSREVADCSDAIRRHARHGGDYPQHDGDGDGDDDGHPQHDDSHHDHNHHACQSLTVRDWGHRMLGLSALWCDGAAFRALELGFASAATRRNHKRSDGRRHHIRSSARMPHLALPCEACLLAAIGARSQALVDLRAGLLSRMALAADERRRLGDKGKGKGKGRADDEGRHPAAPRTRFPHLWKLVEAYVDAFDAATAASIRHNSELLAPILLAVRACEARRRRHLEREKSLRRKQSAQHGHSHQHDRHGRHGRHGRDDGHHHHHHRSAKPPVRQATKYGHRQPLPLLPDSLDPWTTGHGEPHQPHRTQRTPRTVASTRHQHDTPADEPRGHDRMYTISTVSPHTPRTMPEDAFSTPRDEVAASALLAAAAEVARKETGEPKEAQTPLPDWSWEDQYVDLMIHDSDASRVPTVYYTGQQQNTPNAGAVRNSFATITAHTSLASPLPPVLRRRSSRLPVRALASSSAVEPLPAPVASRLSRPASHIPTPRSSAASSSIRTASNAGRPSPQSTTRNTTRGWSTSQSSPPSTADVPPKTSHRRGRSSPATPPNKPHRRARSPPATPPIKAHRRHRPPPLEAPQTKLYRPQPSPGPPPSNPLPPTPARQHNHPLRPPFGSSSFCERMSAGPRRSTALLSPLPPGTKPGNANSYLALQEGVAADFQSLRFRFPSTRMPSGGGETTPRGSGRHDSPTVPVSHRPRASHPATAGQSVSSMYSSDNAPPPPQPRWWEDDWCASPVAPEDSVSCVAERRSELAQRELARERQELLRLRLQQEQQERQLERQRTLEQLTGGYRSPSQLTAQPAASPGRAAVPSSSYGRTALPSSYRTASMLQPLRPSLQPSPLQVHRPPLTPSPQQQQTLRLHPWTRLQVQMHCRPLPPLPRPGTNSTAVTRWPDVRPYL